MQCVHSIVYVCECLLFIIFCVECISASPSVHSLLPSVPLIPECATNGRSRCSALLLVSPGIISLACMCVCSHVFRSWGVYDGFLDGIFRLLISTDSRIGGLKKKFLSSIIC